MFQVQLSTLTQLLTLHPQLITRPGTALRIDNAPWMYLAIENIGAGPRGLPALSVAHSGEQNGDLMSDPEMCFEMVIVNGAVTAFQPYYFRNDYTGCEQTSVKPNGISQRDIDWVMLNGQCEFADIWDTNLNDQGFPQAATTAQLVTA